ncbi:hypothetical protein [Kingella potus]|nr:hypothetical protein [Kingella potus]
MFANDREGRTEPAARQYGGHRPSEKRLIRFQTAFCLFVCL